MRKIEINNDQQLREALNELDLADQRRLGAQFVLSVSHLCTHTTITQGLKTLENIAVDTQDIESAYRNVKALSIEKYTACGRDADWSTQAEHFVASALSACLLPEDQLTPKDNLAWKAAMQARMARNCEMIMNDRGEVDNEAVRQYTITYHYLKQR